MGRDLICLDPCSIPTPKTVARTCEVLNKYLSKIELLGKWWERVALMRTKQNSHVKRRWEDGGRKIPGRLNKIS